MKSFLIFAFALFSLNASADILFLDLNDAPAEIAAARRAAAARGERVIVFPVVAPEVRRRIQELRSVYERASSVRSACKENCESLQQQQNSAYNALQSVRNENRMNGEKLKEEIGRLKAQNTTLTSIVISGHDGNGGFGGENGSLSEQQMAEALAAHPPMADSVRSLLLWGCYTATPASIEMQWKTPFPNLVAVAGFDGSAPGKDKLGAATYLEDFLKKEKQLTAMTDARQLNNAFLSIRNISIMTSAACVNGIYMRPGQAPQSMESLMGECRDLAIKIKAQKEAGGSTDIYQCYLLGEAGCEDPPANPHSSPLRQYYNDLQATKHCDEALSSVGIVRPSPDEVIRLIYFRNVVNNYEIIHKEDIDKVNAVLDKVNAAPDLRIKDFSKMSRAEIIKKFAAITEYTDKNKIKITPEMTEEDIEFNSSLQLVQSHVEIHASVLNKLGNIPFEWVEPNAAEKSKMFTLTEGIETFRRREYGKVANAAVSAIRERALSMSPEGQSLLQSYANLNAPTDNTFAKYQELSSEFEVSLTKVPDSTWQQTREALESARANIPANYPEERRAQLLIYIQGSLDAISQKRIY